MPVFSLHDFLHQFVYDKNNPLLFNNGFFLYFFAIFICCYYALRNVNYGRSVVVSLFSLYFFYKASGYFVVLVMISAVTDYLLSNWIYKVQDKKYKKVLLLFSVCINLGLLFYFKYTNFFIALSNTLFSSHTSLLNIMLPVGISFYTFENLSYTIDVYRGEFVPEKKFINYLLFLSFFPKLVMGPIVRAKDFIPQLHKPYYVSRADFAEGFYLIFSGLFKKLIISDYLTLNFVNYIFDDPSRYTGLECVFAVLGYAIIIYCDFSGYSDTAIGIAKWLGINIPPNFRSPYQSKTITEFWRRWHISLSSWLRDYLYIFWLGGNRKGKIRTYINLMITMLLGGLWHGANWTFVVWGAIHGVGLAFHKIWMELTEKKWATFNNSVIYNFISGLFTFTFVCFAWIFFKSANFQVASQMIHQITHDFSFSVWLPFWNNYHSIIYMMLLGYALHMIPDNVPKNLSRIFLEKAPMYAYVLIFIAFILVYAQYKSATPVMPIYLQF
jgi:D-alanyl-lipoteichoic acid acyltransferase DltB (MBOAT superfamily)